ncbi:MAG: cytidylate kinase-like family protein [Pseudomonadota bacterium]
MQLICVSRGTYSGGRRLAENLAAKLGHSCLSREDLSDAATSAGIAVGKLEMAVLRKRPLNDWLSIEKERFKAFVAATLADRAMKGGLVYHGRHAHLQLPGVNHVLRVRAIMDAEMRVALTMQRLGIPRDKAKLYNEEIDDDRARYMRTMYGVDWEDPANYDMVLNLSHVNVDNGAAALLGMAQLPEFQSTPASERALKDISLAAHCRLAIADHPPTRLADVQVRASNSRVLVTYLPRQQALAIPLQQVLAKVDGIRELVCTKAATNILWIQEQHDASHETLEQILDLASRWDAAVELLQLTESCTPTLQPAEDPEVMLLGAVQQTADREGHAGILDDSAHVDRSEDTENARRSMEQLITAGRAGGHRRVGGGPKELLASIDRTAAYSLVVVGDVFLCKGASVRKRLTQELIGFLSDKLGTPVVGSEELREQYAFGARQWFELVLFGGISALTFGLIISNQSAVLSFMSEPGTLHHVLSTLCLLVIAPVFAYLYGNFARYLLRLLRFE